MANNEKVLNTRIKLKIATYAEWTDESKALKGANFVLKRGEIGLCEIPSGNTEATTAPTVLFKVGDGTNAFKDLKWASALAADVYAWAKQAELPISDPDKNTKNGISGITFGTWTEGDKTIYGLKVARTNFATAEELAAVDAKFATIDTDTDTRYDFTLEESGDKKGQLKIVETTYNVKSNKAVSSNTKHIDFLTQDEFTALITPILAGYVKSVDKKANTAIEVTYATDDTNKQNPKVGLILDATSSNAKGGTAVKLSQSNSGLKAEVDLSNYATKAEIPTDFGVTSIITSDDNVVELTPTTSTKGDVTITGAHAKKGPTNGYTSGNNVTSIGPGESKTIKLPQLTVDAYGHVNTAADEDVTITIPSLDAYATKKYVDDNEKDTKTTVSAGEYIDVVITTNNGQWKENDTNDFQVSVNEAALKTLIGKETTAAMEFKGTTSSLPTNPSNGDMWKVVDVNSSTTNNITVDGVKAKAGDAIVANVVVNADDTKTVTWYLIPAGDSDTNTWRVLKVEGSNINNDHTVNFVGGDHITVTQSPNTSDANITDVTISLDHDYISGYTYDDDKAIGFDIYREGVCEGVSTQERLAGMVIEEGIDIEFETEITDNNKLVIAAINHATINAASSNDAATLVHKGTFDAITSIATSSTGHITEIKTTTFTLPEEYTHPNAANTESSNETALAHGDSFDVVTESFDDQGHRIGTHTETYILPELPTPEDIGAATPANIGNGKFTVRGATNGAIELVEQSTGIMTANQATGTDTKAILDVKDKGITTAKLADKAVTTEKIADQAVGAEQTKAYQKADGTSEEVWVFDCGGAE